MKKILVTKRNVLEVLKNVDGTITLIHFIERNPIMNQGRFIENWGGVEKVLSDCISEEEYAERFRAKIERQELRKKEHEVYIKELTEKYNELARGVIPVTFENLSIVLRYLNTMNWGLWKLPQMNIGYTANQYDCDGKQASTIKLDKPIYDEEREISSSKFVVGAPHGHLTGYTRV